MEWLLEFFEHYPYVGVGIVFLLLGIGLPIPEEVVLVLAGFICHKLPAEVSVEVMVIVCAVSILMGDLIPFTLGNLFGPRLLRVRFLRVIVSRQRLATFDRWFRKRGDLVIFFARFVPGLRTVAYFTAGTMQMSWLRFLSLDIAGILLVAPVFVVIGFASGEGIDEAIAWVRRGEKGILITCVVGALVAAVWYWVRRRRLRRLLVEGPREAFVEPSIPQAQGVAKDEGEPDGGAKGKQEQDDPTAGPYEPPPPQQTSTKPQVDVAKGNINGDSSKEPEDSPEPTSKDDPDGTVTHGRS